MTEYVYPTVGEVVDVSRKLWSKGKLARVPFPDGTGYYELRPISYDPIYEEWKQAFMRLNGQIRSKNSADRTVSKKKSAGSRRTKKYSK